MGLQSAMTTALTGLQAAEATIDVVGNNVANSNTVGFKESSVNFATQFLQTQSIGGGPTATSGGTNPRQTGLGVKVAEITPDFSQGTIEISSNPLDVAIQGDGFLIVQGPQGSSQRFYSRNGQLKTNANNEVVTVTGYRLLGFGVNDQNEIQTGTLTALTIPFGAAAVAQATQTATLTGNLDATGTLEETPGILESVVLSNNNIEFPTDLAANSLGQLQPPNVTGTAPAAGGVGAIGAGTYNYKFVFVNPSAATGFDEGAPSAATATVTVGAGSDISITGIPTSASPLDETRIYRQNGSGDYQLVDTIASSLTAYTDNIPDGSLGSVLDESSIDTVNYSYFTTFYNSSNGFESRPTSQTVSVPVTETNRRIQIQNLPTLANPADNPSGFDQIRIYRNVDNQPDNFYVVDSLALGTTSYIDKTPDSAIINTSNLLDRNGPAITTSLELVNVSTFDGSKYVDLFREGTLSFTGSRGTAALAGKDLEITTSTTVQELIDFMEQSLGIHTFSPDLDNPIPGSPGGRVNGNSQLQFTSNDGIANELDISLSAFEFTAANGAPESVPLLFTQTQQAQGESTSSEFIAYDSLGSPLTVKVSMVLESRDSTSTTFRWFANSADNQPIDGVDTTAGTGLVTFDSSGQFFSATDSTVQIERRDVASSTPVEFEVDFSSITAVDNPSTLNLTNQDGFSAGSLTSFSITESGRIKGVYSNGTTRDIGQIQMARFTNNAGLEQLGDNLFAEGINSGVPFTGDPGSSGLGGLTSGAVELSNTDIGQNLIDLILASTQYRGNARVISAAQDLLDELMNLR
ncbi:MAG: flagellar hook-basal body complex protein [Planctomycetes bacterium]|nr:flagellar hook-basal body complex protein [Planctomycetota bacterium]